MISVLNRLLRSSGSSLVVLSFLILGACSPKIRPLPDKKPPVPAEQPKPVAPPKDSKLPIRVALILPFNATRTMSKAKADVDRAGMAIDFYQGFKLGIDSASLSGRNYEIQVLDSKTGTATTPVLLRQSTVMQADLVVGPVFPENIRQLQGQAPSTFFVSPLAASLPSDFKNPRLISLTPNIKLHADRIAGHIKRMPRSASINVVLINPKGSDVIFADQLRARLIGDNKYVFQDFTSVSELETKIQAGRQYVIVITSSDKNTITQSLDKLSRLKTRYGNEIDVFGHPNWIKQNYNADKLQTLRTIVSTSFHVNYKRQAVIDFVKRYREQYQFEPNEFAFKGFDAGYYFGKMLAKHGKNFFEDLTRDDYAGLHNNYKFDKVPGEGFVNNEVHLLQYKNFQLVEIK